MNPKVDILLATYNGEKYIKEQVESILNQTYENIQIIISDDCSTDKTRQVLKEYENNEKMERCQSVHKNYDWLRSRYYCRSDV